MTTVRSCVCAAAQMGSHSGSSSVMAGGQIGRMPTGQSSFAQRPISATDPGIARRDEQYASQASGKGAQ